MILSWCTTPAKPTPTDTFDENHSQDMEHKEQTADALSWQTVSTIDLLKPSNPEIISEEIVEYSSGVNGLLVYPTNNLNAPAVIMIHERRGLNDHIKDMGRVLAMNGYRVLAVDLYRGQIATTSDQAMTLSRSLDQTGALAQLLDAEAFLRQMSPKVISLGRCMWGAQSLNLSLASNSLDWTIIYYGRVTDNVDRLRTINSPVLGIFAENDTGIPPSAVNAFQSGLVNAGITDTSITIYPDTDHAFANPTGDNYAAQATIDAWNKTLTFLEQFK